jgi:hypothetical protein
MSIELLVLVYVTFKRHSGVYFWSIIITTLGIIFQTTGYILKEFQNNCPPILVVIICKLGWVSNVTGFSIVLWSRLHLVVNNTRILKFVLVMILIDGLVCHTPIVVFEFGLISKHHSTYYHPMQIMERIQQTIFTLQETIISSIYIYHTARFLNVGYAMHTRKVIGLLLCVQVLVVALDATLTVFDYTDKFTLKCTIHPFVYSVKLKLEFIVLNQLQTLVKRGMTPGLSLGSKIPVPSSKPDDPSPSLGFAAPKEKQKSSPMFEGGFITKASAAAVSPVPSAGDSTADTLEGDGERLGNAQRDSSQNLQGEGEEHDLKDVVGSPDGETEGLGDIERQYLGRWERV